MARCAASADCNGGVCSALFEPAAGGGLFRRRWHLQAPTGVPASLPVCAAACDVSAAGSTCLAGVAAPTTTEAPVADENRPSGGIQVPNTWTGALVGSPNCINATLLFDRAGDVAHANPIVECAEPAKFGEAVGSTVRTVAPGSLAPPDGAGRPVACLDPAIPSTGVASHLAPLGWSWVCAQDPLTVNTANLDAFPCGTAGPACNGGSRYTCAAVNGLRDISPTSRGAIDAATQCSSGALLTGSCKPRGTGGLCATGKQCTAGCTAAVSRCGALLGGGAVILGSPDFNEPAIFRQCRANAYSSGDFCLAQSGATQSDATLCASGTSAGGTCAPAGLGGICGASADCAGTSLCLVEERRCVDPGNASIAASGCASGRLAGGTCQAGERGESCVIGTTSTVTGTCKTGLACLDRVCR